MQSHSFSIIIENSDRDLFKLIIEKLDGAILLAIGLTQGVNIER